MREKELKNMDTSEKRGIESSTIIQSTISPFESEARIDKNKNKSGSNEDGKYSLLESVKSLLLTLFLVLVIVIPIRTYVGKPFLVNGSSMDPSFETWDYLLIDIFTYKFLHDPERGDVIVFKAPIDKDKYFIKRIIGLPGETVEINNGKVIIYNGAHPDGMQLDEPYVSEKNIAHNTLKMGLGKDEYFVMGDNRAGSYDSRFWGPLKRDEIVGRAFLRLYPFNEIALFPASYDFMK